VKAAKSSLPVALLRAARPKQWAKNVLVAAAPGAAGVLGQRRVLEHTALAFIAFCLVASGTYLLNDVRDVESDRRHPTKHRRPIAAGELSEGMAVVAGIVGILAGLAVALAVNWKFAAVVGVYMAISVSYTIWLKHVTVIDIAAVASGYVIRAVAGGVAIPVPISEWFLIVAAAGSVFMVAGKRHGEHLDLGEERGTVRRSLGEYSLSYLRYIWMISSAIAIMGYCLWAFEQAAQRTGFPWYQLSIIPFVLALLRYALLLEAGQGSAPEDLVLGDRTLQILGAIWVAVFAGGVYLGR
jgi:decaprenyl-phosphate phosphoribosyltransferase